MPTGYTAMIEDGATFAQFLWGCAHAFGANGLLRDDGIDAPIPEYKPSEYEKKQLDSALRRLRKLGKMSLTQAALLCQAEFDQQVKRNEETRLRYAQERAQYEAMRVQVEAWDPPTPDHAGLKAFMLEQIKISLPPTEKDLERWYPPPVLQDPARWLAEQLAHAMECVTRASKAWDEELKRTKERNAWNAALAKRVPPPEIPLPKKR